MQHIFRLIRTQFSISRKHQMITGTRVNGFRLKVPPESYKGTDDDWRALSQSQRRRIRKGPEMRERERAYRNRPDVKADISENRKRPEVKAAAQATYLRCKQRKIAARIAEGIMPKNATSSTAVASIVVGGDTEEVHV